MCNEFYETDKTVSNLAYTSISISLHGQYCKQALALLLDNIMADIYLVINELLFSTGAYS